MMNTIRKVTIVVAVFMTNCHVSLKWKIGPVIAHAAISAAAKVNMIGRPVMRAAHLVKCEYHAVRFISCS